MRIGLIITLIFAAVASSYGQRPDGQDEFYTALATGDIVTMKKLLYVDSSLAKGKRGGASYPPLHLAAWSGRTEIGEVLLQNGADVNAKRPYGALLTHSYTALHVAAHKGHKEFVDLLLKYGADVNARNTEVEAYRGDNWSMTPMHSAVLGGNIRLVMALIEKHAKVDEPNYHDLRPLYYAAWNGNAEIVSLLLKHGADINAKGRDPYSFNSAYNAGHMALHIAARKGHLEAVRVLIENGTDVYAQAKSGKSALDEARESRHPEVVKLIENAVKSKK